MWWLYVLSAGGWIVAVAVWFSSRQNGAAVVGDRQQASGRRERAGQPPAASIEPVPAPAAAA